MISCFYVEDLDLDLEQEQVEAEVNEEEEAMVKVMKEDCGREKPYDNALDEVVGHAVEDAWCPEELLVTELIWDEELLVHEVIEQVGGRRSIQSDMEVKL